MIGRCYTVADFSSSFHVPKIFFAPIEKASKELIMQSTMLWFELFIP